ncbi:MAG: serine/threonine protein kinase [Labilithrix sp.]|nr:serine/threonine protein kinase [Labilithrix sp.]
MPDVPRPRLVGRYVLYGELASGGMATVHFGRLSGPVGFSRTVAIKRLHPHFAKDPEFVTMFLDEARLASRIRHPNVVPTLDVVTMEGEIFLVMEYVAGEALSKLLKTAWQRELPVPPRVVATIMSSVLHGLHAAHQAKDEHGRELGIVHRDVSPQNILVGSDGASRVLDFGVAKAAGRMQTTRDGQVKGKIAYMPPEQLSGSTLSRQSDIYAASVVLWEALCGRRLFDGETEALVLVRAIEGKIDPPSSINPAVTKAIDDVVLRGLARDPAARYATARDMALAIEQTVGLASPYEVSEWVEAMAHDELARRAQAIADIEASTLDPTSAPRIGLGPAAGAEPPHSQVSSISVSRPALTTGITPPRSTAMRVFAGVAASLAAIGIVLGAIALQAGSVAGARPEPNELGAARRGLVLVSPPSAPAKAPTSAAADSPRAPVPPVRAAALPPPPKPVAKPVACDPPFTVDPATGRKKYKLECLK